MVNKIKVYEIGNYGDFNYYVFDKKQKVAEQLNNILGEILKLDMLDLCPQNNKKINIEKYTDLHKSDLWKNSKLNVFYGGKKMFMVLHCSQKLRLKFNEALFKVAVMPKYKEIKKKRKKK